MSQFLHIVCLDAPSPPDYGGAIDMHYKIKALASCGYRIILHYFGYRPERNAAGLEKDCIEIHSYPRKTALQSLPFQTPFIVSSRRNPRLVDRLNADDHPILLEGIHCAGLLKGLNDPNRVILRMHNNEAAYYHHLAKTETSPFKRLYFLWESRLLKRYQQHLPKDLKLACLSQHDMVTLQSEYGFEHLSFIPCFLPWQSVKSKAGRGKFCLYHGNMSVSENEEAAWWLIEKVFLHTDANLVVAGKGISPKLMAAAGRMENLRLVNNPSIAEIDSLVAEAHINVLPSLNATGVKLKLLNALLNGRHCITNTAGVQGSGITTGLTVADKPAQWLQAIQNLMEKNFSAEEIAARSAVLECYDNRRNAERLIALW